MEQTKNYEQRNTTHSQYPCGSTYRVNQRTYQVKITPAVGAPYYLVDEDGSGDMAWHRGETRNETNIPQWALASW